MRNLDYFKEYTFLLVVYKEKSLCVLKSKTARHNLLIVIHSGGVIIYFERIEVVNKLMAFAGKLL